MDAVLDASALLAYLQDEDGAETVSEVLEAGCAISAVNLAEVLSKLAEHGADPADTLAELTAIGDAMAVIGPTSEDLIEVARLRPQTRSTGLSLGDRACLALAKRLGLPALTTDRAWTDVSDQAVSVNVVR